MKIYISFGQVHRHQTTDGKVFDKDCLAEIECDSHAEGRQMAFSKFGSSFFTSYSEQDVDFTWFPRGAVKLLQEDEIVREDNETGYPEED